jgi:hypothetical protein
MDVSTILKISLALIAGILLFPVAVSGQGDSCMLLVGTDCNVKSFDPGCCGLTQFLLCQNSTVALLTCNEGLVCVDTDAAKDGIGSNCVIPTFK